MMHRFLRISLALAASITALTALSSSAAADDWPMFGRDATRNAVSPEKGAPTSWNVETGENVKWTAPLGSLTFGDPVVAGGLVWVGTNNEGQRDPQVKGDQSVLMCFRESDGAFVCQYASPRLPSGRIHDWPFSSMAYSPLIERDRLWLTTNRCETVCLDSSPLRREPPGEPKVAWKVDMMQQLGVTPHSNVMAIVHLCSVASYQDSIYVITGNGSDAPMRKVPSPDAPSLICLNKTTGEIVWQDRSPGANILNGQWSSPLVVEIGGRAQVVAAQGDGWVRSFDARSGKLIWKFDTNPKDSVWQYSRGTRNNVLATPVYHEGRIYIANGRHPEQGYDVGWLYCIDPTKEGDVSPELAVDADGKVLPPRRERAIDPDKDERAVPNPNSGVVWSYGGTDPTKKFNFIFGRSVSNVAVHDGLLVAVDLAGFMYCLDAATGKLYWKHDLLSGVYGSPLIVDGKVYIGDEDGEVSILALSKQKKLVNKIQMDSLIFCSPIFANGVLYIATANKLYAIQDEGRRRAARVPRAIFTPTPQDVVEAMLKLAELTADDLVYDLGCGDGRIVITAARKYGCKAVGVEIDRELVKVAVRNAQDAGVAEKVTIRRDDLFKADFHDADVVALYLLAIQNEALIPRLRRLKPGSRILAHEFGIPGIRPDKVISITSKEDGEARPVYLYTTPLKPAPTDGSETVPETRSSQGK